MLNLHFAPSADLLIPELLVCLRSVWTDPFQPPKLLVPSPAVGKWLHLRLADCDVPDGSGRSLGLGCTANIEMLTLERFLWNAFEPAENMRRMDVAVMQQVVCALLNTSLLQEHDYESVNVYLLKPDGTIDPVKRVQLASKISRRFQEYEFNRPSVWDKERRRWRLDGIDAHWLTNKTYCGENTENEPWQKDLYCRVHKCLDRKSASDNGRYVSLPHLYRLRREKGLENGAQWTVPPGHIYLFGVSKVSHFHRNTLVEISQMPGMAMHVFLTNPCAEFWEDVDTRRNRSRLRRAWRSDSGKEDAGITPRSPDDYEKEELKDLAQPPPARDHALLELWGNAGKANIFLWCAHAQWNFEYHSPGWLEVESIPDTLLKAIRYSLLRCQNELKGGGWKADDTLQVLACPDPAREVEELREQILDLVKNNRVRHLNEIIAYLPDPGAYVSQIHRVFGSLKQSDPGYIPYSVLGAPGSDSLFAQGMHTLLEVIEGRFDRAHVFALLRNPIVQSTRKISPEDIFIWEGWAEKLGIFRGYNREHRKEMGDLGQTVTDAHTFELGIGRLLIGNLAAGPVDMKYQLLAGDKEPAVFPVPAFRDFDTSDADSVENFCSLAEDLYKNAELLIAQNSLSGSVEVMTKLVWDWFGIVPDDTTGNMAAEARIRNEFLEAIPAIKMQDDLANREEPAGLKELLALVRECLPEELPAGSKAWVGGITFAPLRPAMIVPHKVIFALGLDATAFPGTNDTPGWDLLSQKHLVGDSDPVQDNRFAFLELLHAAQERLVLSFRARNMQKEEVLLPSSVVLELESYLKGRGLKIKMEASNEDRCLIRRDIPWIVRESLEEIKTPARSRGSWDPSEVRLAGIEQRTGAHKATHRYGIDVGTKENAVQDHLRTTIYDLRTFFANPLEYHLSKTLGIEIDEQPATMDATDEPLRSSPLALSGLQKNVWTGLLLRVFPENEKDARADPMKLCDDAEKIAIEVHREYLVDGGSPEAQFFAMEEQFLINWARNCAAETLDLCNTFGSHKLLRNADLSFKRPGVAGTLTVDMGTGRDCLVECIHGLALAPRSGKGEIGLISIRKEGEARENQDLWLTGVVQWLADRKNNSRQDITLVQLNRGDGKKKTLAKMKNQCVGGHDLEQWLCGLIRMMLIERSCDHLPFAIVRKLCEISDDKKLDLKKLTGENIEEQLSGEHSPYHCYLEAFALVNARIPALSDEDLQRRARARFEPMLEGWIHE